MENVFQNQKQKKRAKVVKRMKNGLESDASSRWGVCSHTLSGTYTQFCSFGLATPLISIFYMEALQKVLLKDC